MTEQIIYTSQLTASGYTQLHNVISNLRFAGHVWTCGGRSAVDCVKLRQLVSCTKA